MGNRYFITPSYVRSAKRESTIVISHRRRRLVTLARAESSPLGLDYLLYSMRIEVPPTIKQKSMGLSERKSTRARLSTFLLTPNKAESYCAQISGFSFGLFGIR